MDKLAEEIMIFLNDNTVQDMLRVFFDYPSRKDLLYYVCSKMQKSMLEAGNADNITGSVYNILLKSLQSYDSIVLFDGMTNEELLNMLRNKGLDYRTTSVEYVDGVLKYCIKPLFNVFDDEFIIDRHTKFKSYIKFLESLSNNDNESVKQLSKDKLKIVKKLANVVPNLEKGFCKCVIKPHGSRLKVNVTTEADYNIITIE